MSNICKVDEQIFSLDFEDKDQYEMSNRAQTTKAVSIMDNEIKEDRADDTLANAPWQYKLMALITALTISVGSQFSFSTISAMKSILKAKLQIGNTRYGVLSSSVSIIGTVFQIAGGYFIDRFGTTWGTLAVNGFVIVGCLLTVIAAKVESFILMVMGRVVFGIGSGLIVTMQEALLSKWFRTQNLAIAIGLQLSISRLASFLGTIASGAIIHETGNWTWVFWVSFILCAFSVIMNLGYTFVIKRLSKHTVAKPQPKLLQSKKLIKWKTVTKFPGYYWLILLLDSIFAGVLASFQTISTDLVQVRFGETTSVAAYTASVSQVVPIVATPLLGMLVDIFGFRIMILILASVFLTLGCALLGWTNVNPAIGMVLNSFSLAMAPLCIITSLGMVLPSDYVGIGLGIDKSLISSSISIMDIIVGVVQDNTPGKSYTGVMTLFVVLSCLSFLLIILLWVMQRLHFGNLLQASRAKRVERMKDINDQQIYLVQNGQDPYINKKGGIFNYVYIGIFIIVLITAWVLFFLFANKGRSPK